MNKVQYTLKEFKYDGELKVGDKVRIYDGSALSIDGQTTDIHVPFAYPELTGTDTILKEIECTVLEVGVKDKFVKGVLQYIYQQDVKLKVGNAVAYTASGALVKSVDNTIKPGDKVEVRDSDDDVWGCKYYYKYIGTATNSKGVPVHVVEDRDGYTTTWKQIRKQVNK